MNISRTSYVECVRCRSLEFGFRTNGIRFRVEALGFGVGVWAWVRFFKVCLRLRQSLTKVKSDLDLGQIYMDTSNMEHNFHEMTS